MSDQVGLQVFVPTTGAAPKVPNSPKSPPSFPRNENAAMIKQDMANAIKQVVDRGGLPASLVTAPGPHLIFRNGQPIYCARCTAIAVYPIHGLLNLCPLHQRDK